jgi:hypothetical protein
MSGLANFSNTGASICPVQLSGTTYDSRSCFASADAVALICSRIPGRFGAHFALTSQT